MDMEDREIVKLFWERSPQAVDALAEAYGPDLRALARRLLQDPQDVEECVNDAYLALWQGIPPAKPAPLLPYALRVVRNLCLKRRRWNRAGKRQSAFDLAYEELEECLGGGEGPEGSLDLEELKDALNSFLSRLSHRDRVLFLGRYWYGSPYKELAQQTGLTENNAMVRVSRLREKLRAHLKKKGVLE